MNKPVLSKSAPVLVEMFAAGGGIAAAAVMAGIRPIVSIEHDPAKPGLSKAMLEQHCNNFVEYGGTILQQTVQSVDWCNIKELHPQVDFLHASPVCSNFSIAKVNGKESQTDIECAIAVAKAIEILQPTVFTLEQVPAYEDSQSWEIIRDKLRSLNYTVWVEKVNFQHFGLAQSRRRMIVRAAANNGYISPLPERQQPKGWYEVIADLIPSMEDSSLVRGQEEQKNKFLEKNDPQPLFIERIGQNSYNPKPGCRPIGTITRSIFTDHKGNNRNKFADIWNPDGTVKSVSIAAMARLQGFPDWYQFDERTAVAGSAIGYSCPPLPFAEIFKGLLPLMQKENRHKYDFYESPVWFATELLKRQNIEGTVLEPCVGHGAIADILKFSPDITNVFTNDFDSNKPADFHYDATLPELWENAPTPDWVVTNPPYSNGMIEIIKHSLAIARKGVAMFCRLSLLEPCENRSDLPAPSKVFILPRFCFRKSKHNKWATDSSTIAIFIWDKTTREQVIESINKSDIDLFYRTPEEIHKINIRDYFTRSSISVNIKKTVVEKAAVKAVTTSTTGANQMFNSELQLMREELEALNNQIDKTSELNEKASKLEELINECIELAQAAGLTGKLQENITRLVWGDSAEVIVQTQEDVERLDTSEPEAQQPRTKKEKLPDGMTTGTLKMIKKEVKEKLDLGIKTKCPTVKETLLNAIADSNYDDEEQIEGLNSVKLDSVDFWLICHDIVNNLKSKTAYEETIEEKLPEVTPTTEEKQTHQEKTQEHQESEIDSWDFPDIETENPSLGKELEEKQAYAIKESLEQQDESLSSEQKNILAEARRNLAERPNSETPNTDNPSESSDAVLQELQRLLAD